MCEYCTLARLHWGQLCSEGPHHITPSLRSRIIAYIELSAHTRAIRATSWIPSRRHGHTKMTTPRHNPTLLLWHTEVGSVRRGFVLEPNPPLVIRKIAAIIYVDLDDVGPILDCESIASFFAVLSIVNIEDAS
jgi:hypothetical protein